MFGDSVRVQRVQLRRLAVRQHGRVEIAPQFFEMADLQVDVVVERPQLQRGFVAQPGAGQVALLLEGMAELHANPVLQRIELQRLLVQPRGFRPLLPLARSIGVAHQGAYPLARLPARDPDAAHARRDPQDSGEVGHRSVAANLERAAYPPGRRRLLCTVVAERARRGQPKSRAGYRAGDDRGYNFAGTISRGRMA